MEYVITKIMSAIIMFLVQLQSKQQQELANMNIGLHFVNPINLLRRMEHKYNHPASLHYDIEEGKDYSHHYPGGNQLCHS